MSFVGFIVSVGLMLIVGRPLLRRLGVPTDMAKAIRWGTFILAGILVVAAVRDYQGGLSAAGTETGDGGASVILQGLLLVLFLFFVAVGKHRMDSWFGGRGRDPSTPGMRLRALPPAPNFPPDGDPPGA
jgi:hypothetical protein